VSIKYIYQLHNAKWHVLYAAVHRQCPSDAWDASMGSVAWEMTLAPIELHGNPNMFMAFIGWVDQMKARLPAMSGAAWHGCCSSIALAIGLLLRDIDMMFGLQPGWVQIGMFQSTF